MRRLARPRLGRVLRLVGWNALILFGLVVLAGGGAELYFRLTTPFRENMTSVRLAPGVGLIHAPLAEVRKTNWRDYWQTTHANSLGFLDREPPTPRRAAESCHVTLIGDSFVNASEAPIRDKVQVQLEELAAREAPGLDVTTSAFGFPGTGQINQLPFYDAYARRLSPNVVVLVFVRNDFLDNSLLLAALARGFNPDHPPHLYARRGADGEMGFVPPASGLEQLGANNLPRLPTPRASLGSRIEWKLREWSYFADWAWIRSGHVRRGFVAPRITTAQRLAWAELISRDPRNASLLEGWSYPNLGDAPFLFQERNQPPVIRDALDVTRFALEQFRERAERDGATLVILASDTLFGEGSPWYSLVHRLSSEIKGGGGGPVISQHDYIAGAGGESWEGRWAHDFHWNAAGHRWAGGSHPRMAEAEPGSVRRRFAVDECLPRAGDRRAGQARVSRARLCSRRATT